MRMCLNRKVLISVAAVAVGVFVIDPHAFTRILPLLLFAICPLSMLVMMRAMSGNKASGNMSGCSSMSSDNETQVASTSPPAVEVAQLRAELDQLRAERLSLPTTLPNSGLPDSGGAVTNSSIS